MPFMRIVKVEIESDHFFLFIINTSIKLFVLGRVCSQLHKYVSEVVPLKEMELLRSII